MGSRPARGPRRPGPAALALSALLCPLVALPTAASARPPSVPAVRGEGAQQQRGEPNQTTSRFLVRYKDTDDVRDAGPRVAAAERKAGRALRVQRKLGIGALLITASGDPTPAQSREVLAALRADPAVEYAEPDVRLQVTRTPSDPRFREQWSYFQDNAGLRLPPAWDLSTGSGPVVAVIDSGITAHPDLAGSLVAGYDFISEPSSARDGDGRDGDPADAGDWHAPFECGTPNSAPSSWHGTHVAGTVAAAWSNGAGGSGASRARVQPVRALGACGGYLSDVLDAVTWAAGGPVPGVPVNPTPARVLNLSLGGYGACSPAFQDAIDDAAARGASVVVAAGNNGGDAALEQPASCGNVITVGATDRAGNRTYYSNFGAALDVVAPGGETDTRAGDGILSTSNTGTTSPAGPGYAFQAGTSMATPHVAAVAALILARKALPPAQVEAALKAGARPVPGSCPGGCGAGLVDAGRTLSAVTGLRPTSTFPNPTARAVPDPGSVTSSVSVSRSGRAPVNSVVSVVVRHPRRGELQLDLIAPDGSAYRLKSSSTTDTRGDVVSSYVRNLSTENAAGTWRLRVRDVAGGNAGHLDRWTLQM